VLFEKLLLLWPHVAFISGLLVFALSRWHTHQSHQEFKNCSPLFRVLKCLFVSPYQINCLLDSRSRHHVNLFTGSGLGIIKVYFG
jgi:hypothetical protein